MRWLAFALLLGLGGCSDPGAIPFDADPYNKQDDVYRDLCFPSCLLGQTCTPDNQCVTTSNPLIDAGTRGDAAGDRGRD